VHRVTDAVLHFALHVLCTEPAKPVSGELRSSFCTTLFGVHRSSWIGQRAPLSVHSVVLVFVTPWSHFLQTATHCSISFGLYEGYRSVAHLFIVPVASCSGEHEITTTARASKAAKRRMKLRPADDPMLTPNSDFRQCLPTTVHYRTALFQFPAYKKAGALLNTRYEGSGGRPARIAAPRRSQRNCEQRHCSFHVAGAQRNPDSKRPQAFARCGNLARSPVGSIAAAAHSARTPLSSITLAHLAASPSIKVLKSSGDLLLTEIAPPLRIRA